MDKINPLRRATGLPEEPASKKEQEGKVRRSGQQNADDRVEISATAREIQQAEKIQQAAPGTLIEDAQKLGLEWYQFGYNLPEADE